VLPGTHVASSDGENASTASERFSFVAGATYRVMLHLAPPAAPAKSASVETSPVTSATTGAQSPRGETKRKPLPPAVVYVGGGAAIVLAGITAWSGFDALSAKNKLPTPPTTADEDGVRSKIKRTDIFLGASVVVG